jgi:hypothetical protein
MADTLGPLRPDEEKIYEGQPKGFPLGDYKTYLEDIMLPEGDDLGIPSDDDSIGEDEIETETGFGSVIGENPSNFHINYITGFRHFAVLHWKTNVRNTLITSLL